MRMVSKQFYLKLIFFVLSLLSALIVIAVSVAGCENFGPSNRHIVTATQEGKRFVCKSCYNEVARAQNEPYLPQELNGVKHKMIKKYTCADCKTIMNIYVADGDLMVKCKRCAPEGIPCDRCIPPVQAKQDNFWGDLLWRDTGP